MKKLVKNRELFREFDIFILTIYINFNYFDINKGSPSITGIQCIHNQDYQRDDNKLSVYQMLLINLL